MRRATARLLPSLALAAYVACASAQTGVMPSDPLTGEVVALAFTLCRGSSPTGFGPSSVHVDGTTVVLTAQVLGSDFSTPSCAFTAGTVTGLAAGSYDAVFVPAAGSIPVAPRYSLGSFVVSQPQGRGRPAMTGLSGNWFDPSHPGTGTNVVQGDSGALFGTWLTYDPANAPTWLVMPAGTWVTPTRFRGLLYTTLGTAADLPWKASDLQSRAWGLLTLDFTSASEASFEVQLVTGETLTQPVRRFRF